MIMEDRKNKCLFFTQQEMLPNDGATEKIIAQRDAINKLGIECKLAHFGHSENKWHFYIDNEIVCSESKYNNLYKRLVEYVVCNGISLLYVRYGVTARPSYNHTMSLLAKKGVRIFLEIPSYPYDGEIRQLSFKKKIKHFIEKFYRNRLKSSVYRIVTFSTDDEIFGIPTIRISNAPARNLPMKKETPIVDSIQMIGVANIAFWHGYDRIIRGLYNYYRGNNSEKVFLTIVGNGNAQCLSQLKELTSKLGLNEYVSFVGPKSSLELDGMFDNYHLAIGCLGCHRKNIIQIKSLKNVEYAMRGIPMVYSEDNTDFDEMPYVIKVPADESDIDIKLLCDFVKNNKFVPSEIHESVKNYSWENQLKTVFHEFL